MRGYTFKELVIVMGIVSMVMTVSLPSLIDWRQNGYYRKTARDIVSALRLARSSAIARTKEVEVDFDLDSNRYRMRVGDQSYGR